MEPHWWRINRVPLIEIINRVASIEKKNLIKIYAKSDVLRWIKGREFSEILDYFNIKSTVL